MSLVFFRFARDKSEECRAELVKEHGDVPAVLKKRGEFMRYFTERHGMRTSIERTSIITVERYALLFDCCSNYYNHIAWKFPAKCPDGNGVCGLDYEKLNNALTFDIPTLYRDQSGEIAKPSKSYYGNDGDYDQYALLDFIELIAQNCRDISDRFWHSYFMHYDLSFAMTRESFRNFREDINAIFDKTGLLYTLTESGIVERIEEHGVLSTETETAIKQVSEQGTRELLEEAIAFFKQPHPAARKGAVEKIWDALERFKTYYPVLDKKSSVAKIVGDMANGQAEFIKLFDDEFRALTSIGNNFRIRHHETNRIDITDNRHYDYLFNRCLSLIALAIQYLH